ncbi:TRAP transporter substrate-binding protein [Alphaproteobacteria bacterium KMM 3653]|uniref:TRAP transporter substrate-binding protein n=1 Tax=Harenicola maris TaxID=2841044 RepID=A0AAP2G7C4_9RHOB|nr:TRAP transporter substrate-binding protein [Harenicola maris]
MNRRAFLKTTALTAGGGAAALAAPAYAQGKRTLTMVTAWGRGSAGVFDSAARTARVIEALTDGQLTIDIKAAGELVGAFEVFDAVSAGQADMYHAADYYFLNQHPAYAFFSTVPFGMTSPEMMNWYYHDGGQQLHDELGAIFGLKSFLSGSTGAQAGGWFRRPINSVDDLQGLRFRMPGLGGEVMGKLGASIQNIPGSEVYQALATGALEGTEWIGPWADEKAGFQEIAKYYYPAGFHEPGAALTLALNRDLYDSLTPQQQVTVELVSNEAHQWTLSLFQAKHGEALSRLQSSGIQVSEFPQPVWDAMAIASREVLEERSDGDLFDKVLASYTASMQSSAGWMGRSEGAYRLQRDRFFG